MKCVTSSAVRPSTTGALSASARWRCFPPTPAMPGCWILPSGWPFDWRAMAIPIQSTSMRPTPTSPSPGPGITTSTVQLSYTATESPIGFSPSLATPQTRSVNCADRENFKYFWLVLVVAYRESTALRRASTNVRIDLSQKPAPFSEPASKLHACAGCARDKPLAIVEDVANDETQRSTVHESFSPLHEASPSRPAAGN